MATVAVTLSHRPEAAPGVAAFEPRDYEYREKLRDASSITVVGPAPSTMAPYEERRDLDHIMGIDWYQQPSRPAVRYRRGRGAGPAAAAKTITDIEGVLVNLPQVTGETLVIAVDMDFAEAATPGCPTPLALKSLVAGLLAIAAERDPSHIFLLVLDEAVEHLATHMVRDHTKSDDSVRGNVRPTFYGPRDRVTTVFRSIPATGRWTGEALLATLLGSAPTLPRRMRTSFRSSEPVAYAVVAEGPGKVTKVDTVDPHLIHIPGMGTDTTIAVEPRSMCIGDDAPEVLPPREAAIVEAVRVIGIVEDGVGVAGVTLRNLADVHAALADVVREGEGRGVGEAAVARSLLGDVADAIRDKIQGSGAPAPPRLGHRSVARNVSMCL